MKNMIYFNKHKMTCTSVKETDILYCWAIETLITVERTSVNDYQLQVGRGKLTLAFFKALTKANPL